MVDNYLNQTYARESGNKKTFNEWSDFIYQPDLFPNNDFGGIAKDNQKRGFFRIMNDNSVKALFLIFRTGESNYPTQT
jgi:hypothetical protein